MASLPILKDSQYYEYKSAIERYAKLGKTERRAKLDILLDELRFKYYHNKDVDRLMDYIRKEY